MRLPITIRRTKNIEAEQKARTKLFMRRNSVITRLEKDNQAMRQVLTEIFERGASEKAKTPKGAGALLL